MEGLCARFVLCRESGTGTCPLWATCILPPGLSFPNELGGFQVCVDPQTLD